MEKFIVIAAFAVMLVILLIAYERPEQGKKNIAGRGGDFES